MTPDQCRAARALLDLTRPELANRANVSRNVIGNFEGGRVQPSRQTIQKLRSAFMMLGIRFINDEDGVGVRRGNTLDELATAAQYVDHVKPLRTSRISPMGVIAPEQSRAARAFLGYSQGEAAKEAGVGLSLLVSFEVGLRIPQPGNLAKIRAMYEHKGVVFTEIDERPAVQFLGNDQVPPRAPPDQSDRHTMVGSNQPCSHVGLSDRVRRS